MKTAPCSAQRRAIGRPEDPTEGSPNLPGLIDAHTHWCLFGRNPADVMVALEWLAAGGFEAVVVFPLPGLGASAGKVLDMVPGAYQDLAGRTPVRTASDDLDSWLDFERRWKARPRPRHAGKRRDRFP